jgi:Mg2+-importing ATPase
MGPLAGYFKLQPLPLTFFPVLLGIVLGYMVLTQMMKGFYIRHFGWH